jgi:hypothetical protein
MLAVGGGLLAIWLEVDHDPALALAEPSAESAIAAEGEAMMF